MRFKDGYLSEDMDWCGDLLLYAQRFDFMIIHSMRIDNNGMVQLLLEKLKS